VVPFTTFKHTFAFFDKNNLLESLLNVALEQGFPTWGAPTPRNTFKIRNRRKTYIYMSFISK